MQGEIYDESLEFVTGATFESLDGELFNSSYVFLNVHQDYVAITPDSISFVKLNQINNSLFISDYTRHVL